MSPWGSWNFRLKPDPECFIVKFTDALLDLNWGRSLHVCMVNKFNFISTRCSAPTILHHIILPTIDCSRPRAGHTIWFMASNFYLIELSILIQVSDGRRGRERRVRIGVVGGAVRERGGPVRPGPVRGHGRGMATSGR